MDLIRLIHSLGHPWLRRKARAELESIHQRHQHATFADETRLQKAATRSGCAISPGITTTGKTLQVPLTEFHAHGAIVGGTGSGKTRAAVSIIQQLITQAATKHLGGIAVLDLKGDLFAHLSVMRDQLEAQGAPVHIFDLTHGDAIIPYDLLLPQAGENQAAVISRRMETLGDLLGTTDLSLRMRRMLRAMLTLLATSQLSFASLESLLEAPSIALRLAAKTKDERLKRYFLQDFPKEKSTTLPALRYRLDPLLASQQVRLSLSAGSQIDFPQAMDHSAVILINLAGVGGQSSRVLQSLILSDLRQATFARRKVDRPFLIVIDEAQLLFKNPTDKANLSTLLCLSRSFGVFTVSITQSLRSAIADASLYADFETNLGWLFMLRSGLTDASLIRPGLPEVDSQSIPKVLNSIPNLPNRQGFFWLRGLGTKAIKTKVHEVISPLRSKASFVDVNLVNLVKERLTAEEKALNSTVEDSDSTGHLEDFLEHLEKEYPE
jgi:hypothetical protein